MLETSDAAFGVGHFRHLTGNWDDIKFSPVIRGLKSHAKAARDNNKGIDPYIPRFEEQGETVIRTTNQLVLQSVSTDPTLHCNTRAVMLDMLRSTENSDMKDKRHQMWLLKWLMGQVRRSELKTSAAKRKAGYEGPKRSASKDAGLGSMYIIRREDSGPRIQDGPTTVNVSGNDPGRCLSKTETRKKREGLKISELVACGASMN
ncbi:hypothetical protein DRE_01272 [Drechslerella stenobrocha 248]|uniref:Uncharacterized protein n=1 Tax=Drechslerella stenobrocha 248 TaxID=1043628 RepID=W7I588_9PEZI|nr:hypothetical protein DRE_01272 [Drechslerella stenobrocha 248]